MNTQTCFAGIANVNLSGAEPVISQDGLEEVSADTSCKVLEGRHRSLSRDLLCLNLNLFSTGSLNRPCFFNISIPFLYRPFLNDLSCHNLDAFFIFLMLYLPDQ